MTTKHTSFQKEVLSPFQDKDGSLQTNKTLIGKLIEKILVETLQIELSDIVSSIEREVYVPNLTKRHKIDVVITLKNGHKIYLNVSRDLWDGTSQSDRLFGFYDYVHELAKNGKFYDYACFCENDVLTYLELTEKKSLDKWLTNQDKAGDNDFVGRRSLEIYNTVLELYLTNRLHNLDSLIDHIRKAYKR